MAKLHKYVSSRLCTKHCLDTTRLRAARAGGGEGGSGVAARASLGWGGAWGRGDSSGGCVKQLFDHLLHLLRSILVILLGVLGEGNVGTSGRNTNNEIRV